MKTFEEKNLIDKIKDADIEAFSEAYDLYIEAIYRFIYFKIGNKEEAKDLSSTVFLKVWNYLCDNKLDRSKSLKSFIYKVARNLVIDHYRKNKNIEVSSINNIEEGDRDFIDEKQNIAEQLEIKFDFHGLMEALKKVKEEYREVIVLRHVDELSFAEIAHILGKSRLNVRVLLHRALEALKKVLENN